MLKRLRAEWYVMRMRLGAWIIGDTMIAGLCMMYIIREKAEKAITKDGHVILAECPALADALYRPEKIYTQYRQDGYEWVVQKRKPIDAEPSSLKLIK